MNALKSALAVTAVALARAALAQPSSIESMGAFPDQTVYYATSYPTAISPDGSTVVGQAGRNNGNHAFRWTHAGGLEDLGTFEFPNASNAAGVSADGSLVIGSAGGYLGLGQCAFRWTASGGMQPLGPANAPGFSLIPAGMSRDGAVVAGSWGGLPQRWTSATGMVQLNPLPDGNQSVVRGISPDGSNILGWSGLSGYWAHAARWDAEGPHDLGVLTGATFSEAYASTPNCSVIVGVASGATPRMIMWSAAGVTDLPVFPGTTSLVPSGISDDGSVVVGYASVGGSGVGFVWTAQTGTIPVAAYLRSRGVDTTGWTLSSALAVSGDGTAIVGLHVTVAPPFEVRRAFRAVAPPCYANCDTSQNPPVLNIQDFTCFLQKFAAGDAYANCDGSTQPPALNVADFACFLQKYSAGCP